MARSKQKRVRFNEPADEGGAQIRDAVIAVIENQIAENNPPITAQTLNRLLAEGYRRDDAIKLIAGVLLKEMWTMAHEHKEYDEARYTKLLNELK